MTGKTNDDQTEWQADKLLDWPTTSGAVEMARWKTKRQGWLRNQAKVQWGRFVEKGMMGGLHEGEDGSEEWGIDKGRESSQSKDKRRHWRRGGSAVVRERWRDSKEVFNKEEIIKLSPSEECLSASSLCQYQEETGPSDSFTSSSTGTGDFKNQDRNGLLKGCYHAQDGRRAAYDLQITSE